MANVLNLYVQQIIDKNNPSGMACFYESLSKELIDTGNNVLCVNMLSYNKYQRTHDLIIITARANPDLAREQIKSLGIDKYIKNLYVVPQTPNVSNSKADILIKTNTSVFIGDTCSDFTAARIANVKFIHRDCGFHNMEFVYGK